jgi:hypothetical protein
VPGALQVRQKEKRMRLQTEISKGLHDKLQETRAMLEAATDTEAVRRSISITHRVMVAMTDGEVIFRGKDGREKSLKVF